jgi:hypothetical protein
LPAFIQVSSSNSIRPSSKQAVSNLNASISSATDALFSVGLAQIVAMAGDPHTVLYLDGKTRGGLGFQTLPISLIALDDGMFVTAALQPYGHAVGTKVVSVNSVPIDSVVEQLGTVFAHDNNQWGRYWAAQFLSSQQVLLGPPHLSA